MFLNYTLEQKTLFQSPSLAKIVYRVTPFGLERYNENTFSIWEDYVTPAEIMDENGNANCYDCKGCHNCYDCVKCINCTDCDCCYDCVDSKECERCSGCDGCNNCNFSSHTPLTLGGYIGIIFSCFICTTIVIGLVYLSTCIHP